MMVGLRWGIGYGFRSFLLRDGGVISSVFTGTRRKSNPVPIRIKFAVGAGIGQ